MVRGPDLGVRVCSGRALGVSLVRFRARVVTRDRFSWGKVPRELLNRLAPIERPIEKLVKIVLQVSDRIGKIVNLNLRSHLFHFIFLKVPGPRANPGSFWFSFIFSF